MEKENKVLFALMLAVFAIVACAFIMFDDGDVSATDGTWSSEGVTSLSGEGTETNPYKIGTANELAFLAEKINAGEEYVGKYYVLVSDINLAGKEWVPIGKKIGGENYIQAEDKPFIGVFDGNNHRIEGLSINYDGSGKYVHNGLFGITSSNAVIDNVLNGYEPDMQKIIDWSKKSTVLKNIVLTDVNISINGKAVGALVGMATNTYIENVNVENGSLKTSGNSGGVIGFLAGSVVKDVSTGENYAIGTVENKGYSIGGIVGSVRGTTPENRMIGGELKTVVVGGNNVIINSINNAMVNVFITSASAAGILGNIADEPASTLVYGCVNNGPVSIKTNDHTKGDYLQNSATGIVGHSNGQITTSIINCTNHGKISNVGDIKAGSLAGISKYTAGLISGCVNRGEIVGDAEIRSGIISHNYGKLAIRNCYNNGNVAKGNDNAIVADIIGYNQECLTIRDMILDSATEFERYIPQSIGFPLIIENINCPKESTIVLNVARAVSNVKIDINNSFNGSTFEIKDNKKCDVEVHVKNSDVSILFSGNIDGTTSIHCDKIEVIASGNLSTFHLYGDNNRLELSGTVHNVVIGKDASKSNNNYLIVKGSVVGNYIICGDGNVISNSGNVGTMGIKGEKNTFTNEKNAGVGTRFSVQGGSNTIRNFGTIYSLEFTGMDGFVVNEKDSKIIHGSAGNGDYAIWVGTPLGKKYVDTSITIHNFGVIEGGNQYVFYTAGFENITWYNYEGSEIKQNDSLFCFQQKGYPTTEETMMRGSCNMNFYFVEGTIKKGNDNVTINDTSFSVASQGTKADYGFIGNKDDSKVGLIELNYGEGVDVATEETFVPVFKGKTFTLPTPSKDGYNFDGWYDGDSKYMGTKVDSLTKLPKTELTANWGEKSIKITTSCSPSDGGTVTGASSYDNDDTVTLKAVANDGYRFLRWNDGKTDATKTFAATTNATYIAEFVKLVTVTFDNNGNKAIETIDKGNKVTKPADPSRSGYVFSGWYDGTSKWDFNTVVNDDITLTAKWVKDSNVIVISYKDGKVDFNVPIATVATKIIIELPNNVSVTLEDNTVDSVSGSNITASVTKLTSDMFEITVNKDGTTMNSSMSITLPYTSGKGTPSVYYYPGSGDKVLMGGTIDAATSTITFQTDHNSVYGIVYATPTPDVPVPPITPGDDNNTIVNVTKEGTNQNVTFMAAIATMVASLLLLAVVIKRK
ncbi:InlB B-repeat-containing protein [Candidatus Methanarcanum hacksteinii]|uniref:InlB B-repeat-containing protein n=1 Tax=Candidatus Methanarcanum hacksteinii TaxID=2911857 RepID=UPI0037DBF27C